MSHKLAIAFIHGIGRTEPGYSAAMRRCLTRRFTEGIRGAVSDPSAELVFEEWIGAPRFNLTRIGCGAGWSPPPECATRVSGSSW